MVNFVGIISRDGKKFARAYHVENYEKAIPKLNELVAQGFDFRVAEDRPKIFKKLCEKNRVIEI